MDGLGGGGKFTDMVLAGGAGIGLSVGGEGVTRFTSWVLLDPTGFGLDEECEDNEFADDVLVDLGTSQGFFNDTFGPVSR